MHAHRIARGDLVSGRVPLPPLEDVLGAQHRPDVILQLIVGHQQALALQRCAIGKGAVGGVGGVGWGGWGGVRLGIRLEHYRCSTADSAPTPLVHPTRQLAPKQVPTPKLKPKATLDPGPCTLHPARTLAMKAA